MYTWSTFFFSICTYVLIIFFFLIEPKWCVHFIPTMIIIELIILSLQMKIIKGQSIFKWLAIVWEFNFFVKCMCTMRSIEKDMKTIRVHCPTFCRGRDFYVTLSRPKSTIQKDSPTSMVGVANSRRINKIWIKFESFLCFFFFFLFLYRPSLINWTIWGVTWAWTARGCKDQRSPVISQKFQALFFLKDNDLLAKRFGFERYLIERFVLFECYRWLLVNFQDGWST